jgi:hypothetical protein
VNPFVTPVIVDMRASKRFSYFKINCMPSITKTRGSGLGYWCSTKGGRLSVEEMSLMQGFCPKVDVPYKDAGLTVSQFGGMLGNAQSFNVVRAIMPRLLFHAKLITHEQLKLVQHDIFG